MGTPGGDALDLCLIATAWYLKSGFWIGIAEVAAGLGFVIFVHELGHFAVAKFCGVKVDKFYLGFDIAGLKLAKFRWGETEYGIGILPLGGYVKMLGQEDNPARLRAEIERAKENAADTAEKSQSRWQCVGSRRCRSGKGSVRSAKLSG